MKRRLAVDQDHVIADLLGYWLKCYNEDYNDNLVRNDVTDWNWDTIVKPMCGKKIYDYLDDPVFFRNLPVIENSQEVLEELSNQYEIFIVTSPWNLSSIIPKAEWLKEHFPFIPEDNYVFTRNKSIANAVALIDDKPSNLETFEGFKILFDAPHNQKEERFLRVNNWIQIKYLLYSTGRLLGIQ